MKSCPFPPRIVAEAQPFWDGCSGHRLQYQCCDDCGTVRWPSSVLCPGCHSQKYHWKTLSGKGTVYSFIVFQRAFHPAMETELPYLVAVIDLDEGPTVLANLVDCPPEGEYCGKQVRLCWLDVRDGLSLPQFRLR